MLDVKGDSAFDLSIYMVDLKSIVSLLRQAALIIWWSKAGELLNHQVKLQRATELLQRDVSLLSSIFLLMQHRDGNIAAHIRIVFLIVLWFQHSLCYRPSLFFQLQEFRGGSRLSPLAGEHK